MSNGIEILHRWGGHGGISTEWELSAADPHHRVVLDEIPDIPLVQKFTGAERYRVSLILPEGVPWDLAGKVAAAWSDAGPSCMERLTRLLRRCGVWGEAFRRHRPIREQFLDARLEHDISIIARAT